MSPVALIRQLLAAQITKVRPLQAETAQAGHEVAAVVELTIAAAFGALHDVCGFASYGVRFLALEGK